MLKYIKNFIKTFCSILLILIIVFDRRIYAGSPDVDLMHDIQTFYGIPEELQLHEHMIATLPTVEAGKYLGLYDWNNNCITIDWSVMGTSRYEYVLAHELAHYYDDVVRHTHNYYDESVMSHEEYEQLDIEVFADNLAQTWCPRPW